MIHCYGMCNSYSSFILAYGLTYISNAIWTLNRCYGFCLLTIVLKLDLYNIVELFRYWQQCWYCNLVSYFRCFTERNLRFLQSFSYCLTMEKNRNSMLLRHCPNLSYIEDGCKIIPLGDSYAVISGNSHGEDSSGSCRIVFECKCPLPGKKEKDWLALYITTLLRYPSTGWNEFTQI